MRPIHSAELLAVGSELTVGETRDTNGGELARALTDLGVEVRRISALPDDRALVDGALRAALADVDLVVTTGGLGPTPDDLTRESIAAVIGETPTVDPELAAWLRNLFERRNLPFPETNLKQAWLTPSTTAIPNANGTAPGWWTEAADGRVVVALPGPPREMRPMWTDWVVPRLRERGLGRESASLTLRTVGLGESHIADRLGPLLERGANPLVATYARHDGVDIRISAIGTPEADATTLVAAAEAEVLHLVGDHVWGRGDTTWAGAVGAALNTRQWRLGIVEVGTRGSVISLLGEGLGDRIGCAELLPERHRTAGGGRLDLARLADRVRRPPGGGDLEVGLAVRCRSRGGDLVVSIAIADPAGTHAERRVAFLAGPMGRTRAALVAAAALHRRLRVGGG